MSKMVLHQSCIYSFFFFFRAVGHLEYGQMYKDEITNILRRTAETCDCLQCFFCIHSMGGGEANLFDLVVNFTILIFRPFSY